jgi:ferredoxin-type protein NapH
MPVDTQKNKRKVITESIVTFLFFLVIGIVLWKSKNQIFFLFNFGYIGFAAAVGELLFGILPREKKIIGRKFSQLMIGLYMLGVLGFLGRENMQIEGFFFYLLAGTFSGPVLHYLIAKIGGTVLFGRGWCSWACWTTMVLDFFPWMKPKLGRLKNWGILRYFHFFISLILVLVLWYVYEMKDFDKHSVIELNWLIIGNLFYFSVAILLTVILKDNRAFCKYVCPIPVLMKIGSRFSIWKINIDRKKCTECKLCELNCPMNVKLLSYMKSNQRINSSECIACQQCVNTCPEGAIKYMKKIDFSFKEYLNFRNE